MTDELFVSDDSHVRTIRLNRPEKRNALSQSLAWDVVRAVDAAAVDDEVCAGSSRCHGGGRLRVWVVVINAAVVVDGGVGGHPG